MSEEIEIEVEFHGNKFLPWWTAESTYHFKHPRNFIRDSDVYYGTFQMYKEKTVRSQHFSRRAAIRWTKRGVRALARADERAFAADERKKRKSQTVKVKI